MTNRGFFKVRYPVLTASRSAQIADDDTSPIPYGRTFTRVCKAAVTAASTAWLQKARLLALFPPRRHASAATSTQNSHRSGTSGCDRAYPVRNRGHLDPRPAACTIVAFRPPR
jgi:hypothetical protein